MSDNLSLSKLIQDVNIMIRIPVPMFEELISKAIPCEEQNNSPLSRLFDLLDNNFINIAFEFFNPIHNITTYCVKDKEDLKNKLKYLYYFEYSYRDKNINLVFIINYYWKVLTRDDSDGSVKVLNFMLLQMFLTTYMQVLLDIDTTNNWLCPNMLFSSHVNDGVLALFKKIRDNNKPKDL